MTASYQELLRQREALDAQIQQARDKEVATAIAKARQLIADFGLTPSDVFPSGRRAKASALASKVAPKYRDPATGQTWTGRGKPPRWIQGQDRVKFAI